MKNDLQKLIDDWLEGKKDSELWPQLEERLDDYVIISRLELWDLIKALGYKPQIDYERFLKLCQEMGL